MPKISNPRPIGPELYNIAIALRPVLASINAAREYMGSPSRAKFYADVLPLLETIKFDDRDKRRWVVVESMDRLIEAKRRKPTSEEQIQSAMASGVSVSTADIPGAHPQVAPRSANDPCSQDEQRQPDRNVVPGRPA